MEDTRLGKYVHIAAPWRVAHAGQGVCAVAVGGVCPDTVAVAVSAAVVVNASTMVQGYVVAWGEGGGGVGGEKLG